MATGSGKLALVVVTLAALPVGAMGCASLANTPEQEVAWSRWRACRGSGTEVNRVQLDGRITFWYDGGGGRQGTLDCLSRATAAGPALPEPIAEPRPRGG